MNVSAIDPASTSAAAAVRPATPPAKKAPPARPAAPAASVQALLTPAATVTTTSVPATVKAEDRSLYLQILKTCGGNVNAALAALAALDAKKSE
jgi:hypothetical protein